ncbi:hypothetical protein AKJ16_DCAP24418 [Drosera capensis]
MLVSLMLRKKLCQWQQNCAVFLVQWFDISSGFARSCCGNLGVTSHSLIKFEGGYNIKTLFKGNRFGIDPYSVHATPTGELLILDSTNINLYKVSTPLSPQDSTLQTYKRSGGEWTRRLRDSREETRRVVERRFKRRRRGVSIILR